MKNIYNVDIDGDAKIVDLLKFLDKYNGTLEVIQVVGPAGGNPYIKLTLNKQMSKEDLESFQIN